MHNTMMIEMLIFIFFFFFSSRRRHTRCSRDWSSDVCSSDLDGDLALELLLPRLEHDRHAAAPELVEDLVLVLELLPHQLELGQLLGGLDRSRREIQAAGAAEFTGVVVLSAAAGTVHQFSEGRGNLRARRSGCQPTSATQ